MYLASCINRIPPSASSSLGPSLGRTVCQLTELILMIKVLGNLLEWCILKGNFSHPRSFIDKNCHMEMFAPKFYCVSKCEKNQQRIILSECFEAETEQIQLFPSFILIPWLLRPLLAGIPGGIPATSYLMICS